MEICGIVWYGRGLECESFGEVGEWVVMIMNCRSRRRCGGKLRIARFISDTKINAGQGGAEG